MKATIPEALLIAVQHQQAGRLPEAEQILRQILQADPDQVDANQLLGLIALQVNQPGLAVEFLERSATLRPDVAEFHNNLGTAYFELRRFDESAACYRRALQLKPDDAMTQCNLANVLKGLGRLEEAAVSYRRSLELNPFHPAAHFLLGVVCKEQGKLDEAAASYRRLLDLQPDFAEARNNLGVVLQEQGKLDEAVACYRQLLQRKSDSVEAHNNLGNALNDLGKAEEAAACFRRALELKPDFPEAWNNLGNALCDLGKPEEAASCFRRALELRPNYAEARNNLGLALYDQGRLEEAAASYRSALERKPDFADALNNLGNAFRALGNPDEAVACFRRAWELDPAFAVALSNLGSVLKDQGNLAEAIDCYRRALILKPDYAEAHSNLLFAMLYCSQYDAAAIFEEHRRWNQQHAAPLARSPELPRDCTPGRRLRIGYVSPDFHSHPVGRFLLPLLANHDRQAFEIFCYSSVRIADAFTERCRTQADVWRDVLRLSDEQLARVIAEDRIDILVDLAMHTAGNRLLAFARKPAPVQMTYLAYCGTTGLAAMDYRLTDPGLDPPGRVQECYSEESIHLPETYWCYEPWPGVPPVNALPARQAGFLTFGCLNNFCKASEPALVVWCRVLQAVPNSRLILHARPGSHRQRVAKMFADNNIASERLVFAASVPPAEYFTLYAGIDIALDPFPYCGGTTTCDALWMGVPVVSLAGDLAVGRGGVSILRNIGLPELIANCEDDYMRIAAELAGDLARLSGLRATLRDRMKASPLMDAPRFARNVEAAYREIWRRWCAN